MLLVGSAKNLAVQASRSKVGDSFTVTADSERPKTGVYRGALRVCAGARHLRPRVAPTDNIGDPSSAQSLGHTPRMGPVTLRVDLRLLQQVPGALATFSRRRCAPPEPPDRRCAPDMREGVPPEGAADGARLRAG